MNVAVIDLGTNTFNLLIFEIPEGKILYNTKIPVKLGKGGLGKRIIQPDAFSRGVEAIQMHRQTCLEFGVRKIYALATSAVRTSENGADFVKAVLSTSGIKINVIDGDTEASIIYNGVKNSIRGIVNQKFLIMDIGGGSTEFILADPAQLLWKKSYPIGGSRLIEMYNPTDPPEADELGAIRQYLRDELEDLFEVCAHHKPQILVGSSGSFDTFAQILAFKQKIYDKPGNGFILPVSDLLELIHQLIRENEQFRLQIPGMESMRADTIHMSALQLEMVLLNVSFPTVMLSTFALKEGVMYQILNNQCPWQESLL